MSAECAVEYWSFPPRYDPDYLPERSSRYWFPRRETMPPEERNDLILERLKEITHYAYHASPFYRGKWDEAGFHPDIPVDETPDVDKNNDAETLNLREHA